MKKTAVIVAGGSGQRMGSELPKQFITIHGKAIFLYSIDAFQSAFRGIDIILVMHIAYHDFASKIITEANYDVTAIKIIPGGKTRFHSVQNGLNELLQEGVVFIHDAVRCLASVDLIQRCYNSCIEKGSAIPVLEVKDSIRKVNPNGTSEIVPRDSLRIVQTPQTFYVNTIKSAFDLEYSPSFTDEASVMDAAGLPLNLIEGEESNIKITFPNDLVFAEWKIGLG